MDIYKINMPSCQASNYYSEKEKCEKNLVFTITDSILVNTSTTVCEKHGKVRQHWRQKREQNTFKRAKSDSFLTYGESCKHEIIPPPPQSNSYVL